MSTCKLSSLLFLFVALPSLLHSQVVILNMVPTDGVLFIGFWIEDALLYYDSVY